MREIDLLHGLLTEARSISNSDMGRVDALCRRIEAVLEGIYGKIAGEVYEFQRLHWADGYNAEDSRVFSNAKRRVINYLEAKLLQIQEFGLPITAAKALENQVKRFEQPQSHQALYSRGQAYDAIQMFIELVRAAKREILLIDPYVDDKVLDMLAAKGEGVSVLILTKKIKPEFRAFCEAFRKQHGSIHVRRSLDFHDRFLVIDMANWYLIGASIKDAGNKIFTVVRVTQAEVVSTLDALIRQSWERSEVEI